MVVVVGVVAVELRDVGLRLRSRPAAAVVTRRRPLLLLLLLLFLRRWRSWWGLPQRLLQ